MDWNGTSTEIDQRLGYRVGEVETELLRRARLLFPGGNHHSWGATLHEGNQTWVGLHPDTIQTPYDELIRLCGKLNLKDGESVTDLGAGYGRLGVILHDLYPGVAFSGIEFVRERVADGKRVYLNLGMDPTKLKEEDLTSDSFSPGFAHHYFIYDFGKVSHMRKLLVKLGDLADQRKFTIVGRGKGIRSLIAHEFLWLTPHYEEENFSIYSF